MGPNRKGTLSKTGPGGQLQDGENHRLRPAELALELAALSSASVPRAPSTELARTWSVTGPVGFGLSLSSKAYS